VEVVKDLAHTAQLHLGINGKITTVEGLEDKSIIIIFSIKLGNPEDILGEARFSNDFALFITAEVLITLKGLEDDKVDSGLSFLVGPEGRRDDSELRDKELVGVDRRDNYDS